MSLGNSTPSHSPSNPTTVGTTIPMPTMTLNSSAYYPSPPLDPVTNTSPISPISRNFLIYDFDFSFIDDDSDHFVLQSLCPALYEIMVNKVERKGKCWVDIMANCMRELHKLGYTPEDVAHTVCKVRLSRHQVNVVQRIKEVNGEIMILSDANEYFIGKVLEHHAIRHHIDYIITNPCTIQPSTSPDTVDPQLSNESLSTIPPSTIPPSQSHLVISRRQPSSTPHSCPRCPVNLCKGLELRTHLSKQSQNGKQFDRLMYVGDGMNDLCPLVEVIGGDERNVFFVRKDRKLWSFLTQTEEGFKLRQSVKCRIEEWKQAEEIEQRMHELGVIGKLAGI
ncbi:phosphatase phospho-type [Paraphysoderma sedebokerense]|nr:phosphatase phospho-type [Paraphysoderma sedebokerense]